MENQSRYLSLDVLRGMTVTLMIVVNTPGNYSTTFGPLLHAHWHGFTPTDWVFPTFLFVVGNAMSFALPKYESLGDSAFLKKVFKRTFLIFLIGYLSYWFPFVHPTPEGGWAFNPFSDTRVFGVLQRIALCYGIASLVLHYWKEKGALIVSGVFLFGYWLVMSIFGDLTLEGNAGLRLDKFLLGDSHLYHGEGVAFDPEGLLSTFPAVVNTFIGYFAGRFIQQHKNQFEVIARMMIAGALLMFAAYWWDLVFPINKKLWTSSFVLYTTGIDLLALSILIYFIDVLQKKKWTYFFEVFGKNTLFIYLLSEVGVILLWFIQPGGSPLFSSAFQRVFQPVFGDYMGSFLFAVSWMLICWAVGYWMDKRKIYIKI
ncbi:MAG: heparan-alpha-glucosaminide N-acetyltransferase domain-containing protein [Cyclobacteriaceae bacterium]|nr:heparan-alpha-glucosaminide N-acetyltransferase domain-containing protein [Cyclobacteriaceae bacterium]